MRDANYEEMFWRKLVTPASCAASLSTKTIPNPFGVDQVHGHCSNEQPHFPDWNQTGCNESGLLVEETFLDSFPRGEKVVLDKRVAIVTSRDIPDAEQAFIAKKMASRQRWKATMRFFPRMNALRKHDGRKLM